MQNLSVKCRSCGSTSVTGAGFNLKGIRRFECRSCKHSFVEGDNLPGMRYTKAVLDFALANRGTLTKPEIQSQIEVKFGVQVDRSTLIRWNKRFANRNNKTISST